MFWNKVGRLQFVHDVALFCHSFNVAHIPMIWRHDYPSSWTRNVSWANHRPTALLKGYTNISKRPANRCITIKHYVIKFVSDLRQVGGYLWVLRFPSLMNSLKLLYKILQFVHDVALFCHSFNVAHIPMIWRHDYPSSWTRNVSCKVVLVFYQHSVVIPHLVYDRLLSLNLKENVQNVR
jgi:hypothetical protein